MIANLEGVVVASRYVEAKDYRTAEEKKAGFRAAPDNYTLVSVLQQAEESAELVNVRDYDLSAVYVSGEICKFACRISPSVYRGTASLRIYKINNGKPDQKKSTKRGDVV